MKVTSRVLARLPYAALIKNPDWRHWTLATGLSRVTIAAAPLALVIGGRYATGSFADGAVLAGVYAFAESLAAPRRGRQLDRSDLHSGLIKALVGGGGVLAVLFAGVLVHLALPLLTVVTAAAAALMSGVQGGLRAYLPELAGPECTEAAFALDAVLLELEWLAAPAIIAGVGLLGVPYLGIGVMLAAALAAVPAVRLLPRLKVSGPAPQTPSPWRNPAARRAFAVSAAFGFTEGTVTVTLAPLLVSLHSRPAYAGLLLVSLSLASAAGGAAFGVLGGRLPGSQHRQADALLGGLGLLSLPVAFASSPWDAALAVTAFGMLVAPLNGLRTQLLSRAVPPAQRAQAFSILYAAMGAGFGASFRAAHVGGVFAGTSATQGVDLAAFVLVHIPPAVTRTRYTRTGAKPPGIS